MTFSRSKEAKTQSRLPFWVGNPEKGQQFLQIFVAISNQGSVKMSHSFNRYLRWITSTKNISYTNYFVNGGLFCTKALKNHQNSLWEPYIKIALIHQMSMKFDKIFCWIDEEQFSLHVYDWNWVIFVLFVH